VYEIFKTQSSESDLDDNNAVDFFDSLNAYPRSLLSDPAYDPDDDSLASLDAAILSVVF
jgi:hypothetical protein